mmetsp:Transcript_32392/g.50223  ORF Transcript_32392/g.50223 Transcript_32392/m.50223 type:complete len:119 (-) Transcript_32392:1034-1390(-)
MIQILFLLPNMNFAGFRKLIAGLWIRHDREQVTQFLDFSGLPNLHSGDSKDLLEVGGGDLHIASRNENVADYRHVEAIDNLRFFPSLVHNHWEPMVFAQGAQWLVDSSLETAHTLIGS